jgi:hypothetical protein
MAMALGDCFVERFRRHAELVRGIVQVMDNDGADFQCHDGQMLGRRTTGE